MNHAQEISCVYTKESLVCTQEIPCACTTLLCMLWAREPRGQGPKRARPGPGTGPSALFGPCPWVPWPRACTRALCMHKGKCRFSGNAWHDHEQMYLPSAVTLLSRFVRDVRNNSTNLSQTIYPTNNSPIAPTIPLQVCAWRGCGTQWTFDDSPSLKTLPTARGEANKEQRTIQTISKTIIFQRVLDSFHFVSRTSYTSLRSRSGHRSRADFAVPIRNHPNQPNPIIPSSIYNVQPSVPFS